MSNLVLDDLIDELKGSYSSVSFLRGSVNLAEAV
jgi:hypothetical protein